MIILGCPDDVSAYYCADGDEALKLSRHGFIALYKDDDGCLYFKRTQKLLKFLGEL